jgi:DNA-binding transcriptional ArsR family regulator
MSDGLPGDEDLSRTAERLEALGHPVRLAVYRSLVRAAPGGRPVGELQTILAIPRSTLSFHLRRLIDVRLVIQERQSTTLFCHADLKVMNETLGFLLRECCQDQAGATLPPTKSSKQLRSSAPKHRPSGVHST